MVCWTQGDFTGNTRYKKIIEAESPEKALEKVKKHIIKYLSTCRRGYSNYIGYINVYTAPEPLLTDKTFYDVNNIPKFEW
jgi:hypothetical protein